MVLTPPPPSVLRRGRGHMSVVPPPPEDDYNPPENVLSEEGKPVKFKELKRLLDQSLYAKGWVVRQGKYRGRPHYRALGEAIGMTAPTITGILFKWNRPERPTLRAIATFFEQDDAPWLIAGGFDPERADGEIQTKRRIKALVQQFAATPDLKERSAKLLDEIKAELWAEQRGNGTQED